MALPVRSRRRPRQGSPSTPSSLILMTKNQIILLALLAAVLFSSLSLFHGLTFDCTNSYTAALAVLPTLYTQLSNEESAAESAAVVSTYTSLASKQSYGLFDDITDASWNLMRSRAHEAHSFVQTEDPAAASARIDHDNPIIWYLTSLEPDFTCPHPTHVGGNDGTVGPAWTCNVHRLATKPDCLVYSIGSSSSSATATGFDAYKWEDGLVEALGDAVCEIHVFSTRDNERAGDASLKNIHYHPWALSSSYHKSYNAHVNRNAHRGDKLNRFTFQETLKKLGHEDRRIDILRIDCEDKTCEWYVSFVAAGGECPSVLSIKSMSHVVFVVFVVVSL